MKKGLTAQGAGHRQVVPMSRVGAGFAPAHGRPQGSPLPETTTRIVWGVASGVLR